MLLIHGEKDTLVYPRNTRLLAERIVAVGGTASTRFYPEMGHNDPLIALAAPWREWTKERRDVADMIADFAHAASTGRKASGTVSVPVQDETR
jgi:acetyl esterase/lipase